MIDSVLKGTGNSRFLKSSVPAGTSWADALAMLQAGTFPIDFNGINNAGFQQVGTPLNKANLLKDATAAQIGLPPSTTPDGMFQALGNTGELHVWRKAVKASAGYTLGSAAQLVNLFGGNTGGSTFRSSSSLSVSDDGTLSLLNEDSRSLAVSWERLVSFLNSGFKSKYIICEGYPNSVYYIPQDAEYSLSGNYLNVSKAQLVSGYPATYTTTYPVSTNPKAYQEGDDAKAAGYVLEASKQMIAFKTTNSSYKYYAYNYAESISVSDDGTVSLVGALKASGKPFQTDSFNAAKGKFCQFIIEDWFDGYVSTEITGIVFIPSDAVFSVTSLQVTCSNVQPVTGYAAIPAGTTIEYLGKLGDKARVQVLSYVGTGTYGSSNPNSLTFGFVPKMVFIFSQLYSNAHVYNASIVPDAGVFATYVTSDGDDTRSGFCHITRKNKTITWYCNDIGVQFNVSGVKYFAVAIG